jgi:predicted peptidase
MKFQLRIHYATNLLLLAGLGLVAARPSCAVVLEREFEALNWKAADGTKYHYRLYLPKAARPAVKEANNTTAQGAVSTSADDLQTQPSIATPSAQPDPHGHWPLLLWIHGQGERGNDNRKSMRWLELVFEPFENSPPFFILVPQQQKEHTSWTGAAGEGVNDMLTIAHRIMEQTVADYPIDEDRIFVSGVSSGGTASWQIACRHPEVFAAVAPLSSGGCDSSSAANLKGVPVWAFHCKTDTLTRPEGVQRTVEVVRQSGGLSHVTLTDRPNGDGWVHDSWTPAFREHGLAQWLIAQRRGAPTAHWPPPEVGSFTLALRTFMRDTPWGQVGVWLAIGVVVVVACVSERRRRLRAQSAERPLPPVFDASIQNHSQDFSHMQPATSEVTG